MMRGKTAGTNGCTGCSACAAVCPNGAIQMIQNQEGFWEARLDAGRCTECGQCGEVCHLMAERSAGQKERPVFYAAYSRDRDNVERSSSGGIFYELCRAVLKKKGIVYGAAWESIHAVAHKRAKTPGEAALFRRSKYLESRLGDSYQRAKQDLEQGRLVLFSGVGCQIAGLYKYLQREYAGLYTCEVVCHGIPSQLAYEKYLDERREQTGSQICELNFRDKSRGWKENAVREVFADGSEYVIPSNVHPLHAVYLKGINMRGICGSCRYARLPRTADMTLADFWQYEGKLAEKNGDRGISLLAVNSGKGRDLLERIREAVVWERVTEEEALGSCRHMSQSPVLYRSQAAFLRMLRRIGFGTAAAVCSEFGPVIQAEELCVVREACGEPSRAGEMSRAGEPSRAKKMSRAKETSRAKKMSRGKESSQVKEISQSGETSQAERTCKVREICRAGDLCQPGELNRTEELCEARLLEAFGKDRREVVYVVDTGNRLKGIVTYGDFLKKYKDRTEWINKDFRRVILSEGCAGTIRELFAACGNLKRIPVVDSAGTLLFEVRRNGAGPVPSRMDARMLETAKKYRELFGGAGLPDVWELAYMEPFLRLCARGIGTYFIKRPEPLPDYPYTESERKRIENQDSFPKLSEDIIKNAAVLKELFGEKFSPSYIKVLRDVPQIVEKNRRFQHMDHGSELIHVIGGCRRTCGQPSEYRSTVHIYGRCGVFGYAVEDADTLPSALQGLFVENGQAVRVVNHGLWGADDRRILHNLSMDVREGIIRQEDQVVLYMGSLPCMEQLERLQLCTWDSTLSFHRFIKGKTVFYDKPGHMTAAGYRFIAERMYEELARPARLAVDEGKKQTLAEILVLYEKAAGTRRASKEGAPRTAAGTGKSPKAGVPGAAGPGKCPAQGGLETYVSWAQREVPYKSGISRGAVVMNCNPFTKGHRYLIEAAAKEVDELLVFVVEEDRSFFPFRDRIEMVKEGTGDLEKVHVLPGGRFMISAFTFPEYFIKEQVQKLKIDPTSDVQLFAGEIAPALHISVRFAGTEPRDSVTRQYNEAMKELLPVYGVRFREIERMRQGQEAVSATDVRRALEEGDEGWLKELVPETTFVYLREHGYMKGRIRQDEAAADAV